MKNFKCSGYVLVVATAFLWAHLTEAFMIRTIVVFLCWLCLFLRMLNPRAKRSMARIAVAVGQQS